MGRGSVAKVEVKSRISSAFGKDYIGEYDGKLYVWANEKEKNPMR